MAITEIQNTLRRCREECRYPDTGETQANRFVQPALRWRKAIKLLPLACFLDILKTTVVIDAKFSVTCPASI